MVLMEPQTNNIQSFNFLKIYLKTHNVLKISNMVEHYNLNDNDANKITTVIRKIK